MDTMILAKDVQFSTDSSRTGTNNNVLVIGGSGSGKTVSIIEPRLLETHDSSLIVTVTKRRIVNRYRQMFQERGYNVLDLNFIHPRESNITYDPMQYIKGYADITFLAQSIIKANHKNENTKADPYWDEASTSLFSALIAYVMMTSKNYTFADVLDLFAELKLKENGKQISTTLDSRFERLERKDPNCFAISCWKTFSCLPINTASCVFSTLSTTIDTIFTPELKKMIGQKKKINFEQIATEKTVLFISTSPVNPALHSFINMFYAQAFKQLFEYAEECPDGALPIPVAVLADDFATGSQILNFPEYISIFREKKISVTLLLQSESQLEAMYGSDNATTIINNCDSYVFLGSMDLRTGVNISTRLNVPLDEVLYMPIGQAVVFHRGQRPIITERYDTFSDKRYQRLSRLLKQQEQAIQMANSRIHA